MPTGKNNPSVNMALRANITPCLQGIKIIISLYSQRFRAAQPLSRETLYGPTHQRAPAGKVFSPIIQERVNIEPIN
jgi:hypothetical protein